MEQQQISPKKQKALDKVKRANAELRSDIFAVTKCHFWLKRVWKGGGGICKIHSDKNVT